MPSALSLIIGANADPFVSKMRLIQRQSQLAAGSIGQTFSGVSSRLVASIGGLVGLGALTRYAKGTADWAGKLRDSADALGVNVEWLQKMQNGAKLAGADIEDLSKFMGEMNKSRQDALDNPKGKNAAAFQRLGATRADLSLNTQALFDKLVTAFASGASIQATNDVQEVGGRSARNLVAAFANQFASDAPILSEQLIDELDMAGDAITDLAQTLRVFFAPAVVYASDLLRASFNNVNATSAGVEDFFANLFTPDASKAMARQRANYREKLDARVQSGDMTPEAADKKWAEFAALAQPEKGSTTMTLGEALKSASSAMLAASAAQEEQASRDAAARLTAREARRARESAPAEFEQIKQIKNSGSKPSLSGLEKIGGLRGVENIPMLDVNKKQLFRLEAIHATLMEQNRADTGGVIF